jgi:hypothetical protein
MTVLIGVMGLGMKIHLEQQQHRTKQDRFEPEEITAQPRTSERPWYAGPQRCMRCSRKLDHMPVGPTAVCGACFGRDR